MNSILKRYLIISSLSFNLINFSEKALAYSEMSLSTSAVFFPMNDMDSGNFSPFWGGNIKADIMNNVGFSFGIGHTWANGYQWADLRTLYWFNQHLEGFYFGLAGHIQYFNNFGVGGGFNLGYSLPLTYYLNFNLDSEAGYGSNKFWRAAYDPIYYNFSVGFSVNIM